MRQGAGLGVAVVVEGVEEQRRDQGEAGTEGAAQPEHRPAGAQAGVDQAFWIILQSAQQGEEDLGAELNGDLDGDLGKGHRQAVDPQLGHGHEFAEHQPVQIAGQEGDQGAQEHPASKVKEFPEGISIPAQTVPDPGVPDMTEQGPDQAVGQAAGHDRPDLGIQPGPEDDHGVGDEGRDQIQGDQPRHGQLAVEQVDAGGGEAVDQGRQTDDGQNIRQHPGHGVVGGEEIRHRLGEEPGDQPEQEATQDLQGPGRAQKHGVGSLLVLDDAGAEPDVRGHLQALQKDRHQGHQAKGLRKQEPGQYQVAAQAQDLGQAIAGQGPEGAAHGELLGGRHSGSLHPLVGPLTGMRSLAIPLVIKGISLSITPMLMRRRVTDRKMKDFDVTFTLKRKLGRGDTEAVGPEGRGWRMAGGDGAQGAARIPWGIRVVGGVRTNGWRVVAVVVGRGVKRAWFPGPQGARGWSGSRRAERSAG